MAALWRTVAPRLERQRRADRHLALAMPELSPSRRREILLGMWDHLGRVAAEGLRLSRIVDDPRRVEIDDAGVPGGLSALRGGFIGVSLHSGNWEVACAAARQLGLPSYGVYRPMTNPYSEAFIRARRSFGYSDLIPTGGRAGIRVAALAKAGGSAIGFLGDLRYGRGHKIEFFGRPSTATTFPYALAQRFGLPLVLVRCIRLGTGTRFRLEIEDLPLGSTGDAEADAGAAAQAAHRRFETWIREYPEQWMWAHRKWDVEPAGPTLPLVGKT